MNPAADLQAWARFKTGLRGWPLFLLLAVSAQAQVQTPQYGPLRFGQKRLSDTTRVPIRGEYEPPQPAGPVSLTTELQPSEVSTPLMPEGMENMPAEPEPVIQTRKRWTFSIDVRSIYDDNIFLSSKGREKSDFVFLFTPSVTFRSGDTATKRDSYVIASYTPSASFFASDSGENSVDHTVRLDMQKRFGKLAVGLEGRYQRLSGATPELSDRVDRDETGAKLRLRYDLSARTNIETSAGYSAVKYRESGLDDYHEWVSETFVGYELSGRTRIAAGGAAGRLDVDGGKPQDYQRALVRVTTDPKGKLTVDAKAGVEFRKTGAGRETTPVFNVSAEYRPTGRTTAGVSVYREVTASGSVENENLTRTGATLRVMQKLGSRFTAGLEAGYEKMEYASTEAGVAGSGREDEYYFLRPSLRYDFSENRRAEIYYSLRRDNSTIGDFDFAANQAGLAIGFDF
ncbi:MAG TPA: outer membrane beta-barrel protein [Verrucomicrobiales bacterium]|nr:outer membrane beta-barrel protein [Verrucomicrobiales bacterium]